jgi:RES domain-containing protein
MSVDLWRVTQYPVIDGSGGLYSHGRWHSKGMAVIYTGEHPALALMEAMAHQVLDVEHIPDTLVLCKIQIPSNLPVYAPSLPIGWQAKELTSRAVGSKWLESGSTPLMRVPSAIVPHGFNTIINPQHPKIAGKIILASTEPVWIDDRFIRT